MKRRLVLVLVVLIAGGALWWRSRPSNELFWQGYAEADYVKVGPVLQGQLTAVAVERGDKVRKGQVLFRQDDADERAALAQAQAAEAQAQAQLTDLVQASRPAEIAAAQANLADAKAADDKAEDDLRRNRLLLKTGFATAQLVAQEEADARSATAHEQALEAQLALAQSSEGRDAAIEAQKHQVAALKAAVDQAQWKLDQRAAYAPADAAVADVIERPGETVNAGDPVVSLLPPGNIFVRFFVGEAHLSQLHLGEMVKLSCDSCAPGMIAKISFIAPETEYTPPVIYSDSQRDKLVTEIEARPDPSQAVLLNPGLPVQVEPVR